MTIKEAVEIRKSRRRFITQPIASSLVDKINALLAEYNRESGLNIQFIINDGSAFHSLRKSYGLFSNVQNYIALVGKKNDEDAKEKSGYYGELLILEATRLGLGTCWVGGAFDKDSCTCKIENDEMLVCVIAIGNVDEKMSFKENLIRGAVRQKKVNAADLYTSDAPPSSEFLNGMDAVSKMPSAKMKMPIMFSYNYDTISASITKQTGFEFVDLGIAKAHFKIGYGNGTWSWGNNARFEYKSSQKNDQSSALDN